ncbi:hypothetical protein BGX26_010361 [Mortierella sp. AD094]|nr:hypothetical protein BGX26_010361 [Mortierella sp. AD094]
MHSSETSIDKSVSIPTECTELILQYLWSDVSTLHRLLLCNREFFALAVPILYRDPFRLVDRHYSWNRVSKSERTAKLMQVLHTCAATMPAQDDQDVEQGRINRGVQPIINPESSIKPLQTPLTTDYLFYYTHQSQIPRAFRAFELLNPSIQKFPVASPYKEHLLAEASTTLYLALYGHFPSRIEVLSMTPSQLAHIWSSSGDSLGVKSLKMLRRLELDFSGTNSQTPTRNGDRNAAGVANILQIPLLFIREHQRIFDTCPEDLAANKSGHYGWGGGPRESNSSVGKRIENGDVGGTLLQEIMIRGSHQTWTPTVLLSEIAPLKVIDLSAWNSKVPNLEQIPSSRLRSLKINIARRLDFVEVPVSFLQNRCPQLQEIWMPAQAVDTFRWAIDLERPIGPFVSEARLRRRQGIRIVNGSSNSVTTAAEDATAMPEAFAEINIGHNHDALIAVQQQLQQQLDQHDPGRSIEATQFPQLQRIRLYGNPQELVLSLEDAADAFRDTLVELAGSEDGFSRRDEYPHMSISWSLPQLTRLDLSGRFVFFFDLKSLRYAPNLRVVKLVVESNILPTYGSERDQEYETPDFSVFTGMLLEELQLLGTCWGIDDTALEVLTGGPSLDNDGKEEQQQPQDNQRPCVLRETLLSFNIADSHLVHRAGLKRFVRKMKKLQVIQLGTNYKYLVESLREEAGPRLHVDLGTLTS